MDIRANCSAIESPSSSIFCSSSFPAVGCVMMDGWRFTLSVVCLCVCTRACVMTPRCKLRAPSDGLECNVCASRVDAEPQPTTSIVFAHHKAKARAIPLCPAHATCGRGEGRGVHMVYLVDFLAIPQLDCLVGGGGVTGTLSSSSCPTTLSAPTCWGKE